MEIVNDILWSHAIAAVGGVKCVCRKGAFTASVDTNSVAANDDGVATVRPRMTMLGSDYRRYSLSPGDWVDIGELRYVIQHYESDGEGLIDVYMEQVE